MENARLYAITTAFIAVAGISVLVRQQMNTSDLLMELRNAKDSLEGAQHQLAGFRESVTAKRAELASLSEKLGGRATSLAAIEQLKAEVEKVKAGIEQIKLKRTDIENEFRSAIRSVRSQTIGKELPPQKLASGAILTHAKVQKVDEEHLVLGHELGVSNLTPKEVPAELAEKLRMGDPLFTNPRPAEKAGTTSRPAPASAPSGADATGAANQRRINEAQDEITKVNVQIAQYDESAKGWRKAAQSYRIKAQSGRINSWGIEATKADGEAEKAEGMIKQLNYRLIELQKKLVEATMGR